MQKAGYPANMQNLIYGGRVLQDSCYLQDYNIKTISTTVLNLRLRGGAGPVKTTSNAGKGIAWTNSSKNP